VTPFDKADEEGWERLCRVDGIPDGGILALEHNGHDLIVYRRGSHVSCMTNACTHRGVRMHFGCVRDGVIMCPYHDWAFDLKTGECLTVPQDTLTVHPVRVRDGYVAVRLPA
jgi:nitrite reductase/ring-hydroxylating ferredoxin subunit